MNEEDTNHFTIEELTNYQEIANDQESTLNRLRTNEALEE